MSSSQDDLPPNTFDAIPLDAIVLGDAIAMVQWAIERDPEVLPSILDNLWLEAIEKNATNVGRVEAAANLTVRDAIWDGQILPCIRDPESGETLRTGDSSRWMADKWLAGDLSSMQPAIMSQYEFVHPSDPSHPGPESATIRGFRRPVFFIRKEFDKWFRSIFESALPSREEIPSVLGYFALINDSKYAVKVAERNSLGEGRESPAADVGRPKGSGSFRNADAPLVDEMAGLVEEGTVSSIEQAAICVAARAIGSGTLESKRKRLARLYVRKYGTLKS